MNTVEFATPAWLLFPVCLALFTWLRARRSVVLAVAVPGLSPADSSMGFAEKCRLVILGTLFWGALGALTIAAAGPRRDLGPIEISTARNILLALDISRSMGAADFSTGRGAMTRIEGVKAVVAEFLKRRPSDRIGLVVFGAKAFVQAPLTLDHEYVAELLEGLEVGMAGDGTAIGEGLGAALKRIEELPADAKAVVLVTDGASNAGSVTPLSAANVAKDLGVKVYTIGIGSHDPITVGYQGGLLGGQAVQRVEFDEETLMQIASITGGRYQNADSLDGLRDVYKEIDRLEKTASDSPTRREYEDLTQLFLIVGSVAFLLFWALRHTFLRVVP